MALTSTRLIDEISLKLTVLDGRDFDHGHHFTKHSFRAKVVVDGEEFVTKSSANGIWNEDFTITIKAESQMKLEVICKHKKAKDDHIIGTNDNRDVLKTISKPNAGVIEVNLLRPGRDKAVGIIRYTIDVIKTHELRRGTHHQASLSWRSLNSAEIIRKVVFNDDLDDLVPPQWACIISSLDGLVENTKDLAELNSSAKVAVGAVCAAIKLIIEQVERDERVESLTETMSTIYYHIQDTNFDKIKSFEETLQRLVKMTTECAYFIASYKQKAFARRTIEGAILGVDGIIKDFEERFAQLRIEFLMGSTLQSTHTVLLVLNKVRNIETLLHLQPLPLIENALWRCVRTPEQQEVLDGLTIWAQNPDERLVSVLVGDTREEASLIAHKLCERFSDQKRLGSAVFFPETTESVELSCRFLVSTIARDLAALDSAFAESIADAIARSPRLARQSDDLSGQFKNLLVHPLQSLTMVGPVLIVIDGLDRCSDHSKFVESLSSSQVLKNIPRNIRFLLIVGPQSELPRPLIRLTNTSLRFWHTGGEIKSQVIANSFWKHISGDYEELQLLDRLEDLKAAMTPVYSCAGLEIPHPTITVPTSSFLLSEIRRLVAQGTPVVPLEPLLNYARQRVPPELMARFESYSCFVAIQASTWNYSFHTLFLELKDIVDPEISSWVQDISNTNYIESLGITPDIFELLPQDRSEYPKALPFLILKYLNMALRPNICRFETITKLNKVIKDLDDRLREHVPATLRLLSGCWSEWVVPCLQTLHEDGRRAALSELRTFLSSHLLSWIELISLLGCADGGLKQLQLLEPVLSQMMEGTSTDIDDIKFIHNAISDSIRFMLYFRTPIWDGGLFVHRLAFLAPTTTFIHQTYAPESMVKSGLNTKWPYKFSIMGIDGCSDILGQATNDPILTSLIWGNSVESWSLETGAHLSTFKVPDYSIISNPDNFLALPSKNHFTFMKEGRVSIFEPDRSVNGLRQLELKGYACSICYTADETSLLLTSVTTDLSFWHSRERYASSIT
ncbi:hypothetical protein BDN72DRAFT_473210 [Pluteus cervinus]|uniref:Uncharacterized protein n=1 Tax=Pluteus cervinus TaxID=181527 RepID=A0ACD3A736_9AGAR|nr:hypothetical protein BDN72DRAFT_473210 [Pluteus cervinus]